MTVIYSILSAIFLYFAGKPIVNYVISHGNIMIQEGVSEYSKANISDISIQVIIKDTKDQSEVQVPTPNAQYAKIICERIDLSAPLFYGDNDTVLQKGVGHYTGSALPGEGRPILISGHDGTYFAPIEFLKTGDQIKITTAYGEFIYEVIGTKIADSEDTKAYDLAQEKEQLILYTCYPFGQLLGDRSERFFVYCDLILQAEESVE